MPSPLTLVPRYPGLLQPAFLAKPQLPRPQPSLELTISSPVSARPDASPRKPSFFAAGGGLTVT